MTDTAGSTARPAVLESGAEVLNGPGSAALLRQHQGQGPHGSGQGAWVTSASAFHGS